MMTSEEFRQARLRLGLRQRVLGVLMGMMPQSINKIERGRREPTGIQAAFMRYMLAHPPDDADVAREAAIMGQATNNEEECNENGKSFGGIAGRQGRRCQGKGRDRQHEPGSIA